MVKGCSSTISLTTALDVVGDRRHTQSALPPKRVPVPIFEKSFGASGPFWKCVEKSKRVSPTGVFTQTDRPARSKLLY